MRDTWDDDSSHKREEPHYVSLDGDEKYVHKTRVAKWKTPKPSGIQAYILRAVGRVKYKDSDEREVLNDIARKSLSLTTGVVSPYPTEWVQHCCTWAAKKNGEKPGTISAENLIKYIRNTEKMNNWLAENRHKFPKKESWS